VLLTEADVLRRDPRARQMPAASVSAGVAWLPAKTLIHNRWGRDGQQVAAGEQLLAPADRLLIDSCLK
jgi:hypothetical protein